MSDLSDNRYPGSEPPLAGSDPGQPSGTSGSQEREAGFSDLKAKAAEDLKQVKEFSEQQAQQAMEKTAEMAAEQKNFVADQLDGLGAALEKVSSELEGEQRTMGRYAGDLGASVKRLAGDLKDRDLGEIAAMAENFGRRQPLAFLGLAALAGFAASRFVTASAQRTSSASASTGAASRSDVYARSMPTGYGADGNQPAPNGLGSGSGSGLTQEEGYNG